MEPKIAELGALLAANGRSETTSIEVDGGITVETAPGAVAAGASILVAGTALFGHDEGLEAAVAELRAVANEARKTADFSAPLWFDGPVGAVDDDPGLPLKLWPCSNGEYLPAAARRAARRGDAQGPGERRRPCPAPRLVAPAVPALGGRDGRRVACAGIGGGRVGPGRSESSAAACSASATRRLRDLAEARGLVHGTADSAGVVDVQTHFLEFGPWGNGFPQASCGEEDWADCFSVEYWYDLVLGGSDTSVAVISAVPVVGEADPLSVAAMERGRELATRGCAATVVS